MGGEIVKYFNATIVVQCRAGAKNCRNECKKIYPGSVHGNLTLLFVSCVKSGGDESQAGLRRNSGHICGAQGAARADLLTGCPFGRLQKSDHNRNDFTDGAFFFVLHFIVSQACTSAVSHAHPLRL